MKKFSFLIPIICVCFISTSIAQTEETKAKKDSTDTNKLDEVRVVGKKTQYERKADRLIFNVENSTAATGGDALDALKVTPGLDVKTDAINMIGKSGMSVMIDDRILPLSGDALISYLRSIPASSIRRIEVISNPPAKYDAQGNSGLINIVLKKITIDSWLLNLRSVYAQSVYASGNFGADYNYKQGKWSVNSSVGLNGGYDYIDLDGYIYYPNDTWNKKNFSKDFDTRLNGKLGIDYDLTDKWSVGALYIGRKSKDSSTLSSNTAITNLDSTPKAYLQSNSTGTGASYNNSINLHTICKIDTLGQKLSLDLDYFSNYNEPLDNTEGNTYDAQKELIPEEYYQNKSSNLGKLDNYSVKLDYSLPTKWAELEFGGKVSTSKSNNDYKLYDNSTGTLDLNTSQTNVFQYTENVQALYASLNKKINDKLDFKLGLRTENTSTVGYSQTIDETNKNNYIEFFPTAFLSYKLTDEKSLSVNYGRRIDRPGFWSLNPFKKYLDQYTYIQGNPFLKPSFSDNFELAYNSQKFQHKFFYTYTTDMSAQVFFNDDADNTTRVFPLNFFNSHVVGLSETYTFNKISWWSSYNSFTGYYNKNQTYLSNTPPDYEIFSGNFNTNNDFFLNKEKTRIFNVGYYYNFPGIYGVMEFDSYSNLYGGFKAQFFEKKMSFAFTVNDVLRTQNQKISQVVAGVKSVYENYYGSQNFRISLSYKFGNTKIQTGNRGTGNDEERKRAGG